MTSTLLSVRDKSEIERSAEEAKHLVLVPVQVDRYLNPCAHTRFALEYAFYLLGDVRGKTVLDYGCGSGENMIPLAKRGACVLGIDISPDLIELARQRIEASGHVGAVKVGSAYETGLPEKSVDVIFCKALLHHLDLDLARKEMKRILAPGGFIIVSEPVRFSALYAALRKLLPDREEISDYEHPLTRKEFAQVCAGFQCDGLRYFRLPFVPLLMRVAPKPWLWKLDGWLLAKLPRLQRWATSVVVKLTKKSADGG
jgi:SAM-dependent methyltransferase